MLFMEIMTICYVNYKEHINTVRVGRTQNLWMVKQLVLVVTTGLRRSKWYIFVQFVLHNPRDLQTRPRLCSARQQQIIEVQ